MLRALESSTVPRTIRELSAQLDLHENTIRMHLTALHRDGHIRQTAVSVTPARGRPATQWEARGQGSSPYVALVKVLAHQLRKESDNPRAAAEEAGVSWGHALAEQHATNHGSESRTPEDTVVEILRNEGFAPERDGNTVDFRQCPLIEAAGADPEIVCAVHLGMVTGALDRLGARDGGSTLEPFSAPGTCTLRLRRAG